MVSVVTCVVTVAAQKWPGQWLDSWQMEKVVEQEKPILLVTMHRTQTKDTQVIHLQKTGNSGLPAEQQIVVLLPLYNQHLLRGLTTWLVHITDWFFHHQTVWRVRSGDTDQTNRDVQNKMNLRVDIHEGMIFELQLHRVSSLHILQY